MNIESSIHALLILRNGGIEYRVSDIRGLAVVVYR